MAKNQMQKKTLWLVETAMLSAIIVLMAFTPVGYLKVGALSITFIMVPVVVGSVVTGPAAGAFLGLVFGITSFVQCFGMDAFGTTLFGINPFFTFLMCIPTRVLAGWLPGLINKAITKGGKRVPLGAAVSSLLGPVFNTVLFMSTLVFCFGKSDYIQELMSQMGSENMIKFVVALVGTQGLIEAGVCFVLATAISTALVKAISKRR